MFRIILMLLTKISAVWMLYHGDVVLCRTGRKRQNQRCIMEMSWYDVPEGTDKINVISWRRRTMTHRKERTKLTLYHGDVVLWRTGRKYQNQRCFMETSYYDVTERNTKANVVSWRRRTMAYTGSKWQIQRYIIETSYYDVPEANNKSTLYHGDVILWRTGRNGQMIRCIIETSNYDLNSETNKMDVASLKRCEGSYNIYIVVS